MPVNQAHYRHHGGGNNVIIVRCPNIAGNHLIHLSQAGQASWVLRDYISGEKLYRSPPPNPSVSQMSLAEIEADADFSEPAPYHAVEHANDWVPYLRLRTMAVFDLHSPPAPAAAARPNSFPGNNWQALP
jgi:hypothetical protein